MNPRNRDARRLRAVRRPHSLMNTLSIRPSSKSNDDTSFFGAALVLFSSSKSREKCRHSGPGTLSPPDIKARKHLAHLPASTARLDWPAAGDCQVRRPATPAWLAIWCKRISSNFFVGLVSRILQPWGLDKRSIPGRLLRRDLLFWPQLPCVACFA